MTPTEQAEAELTEKFIQHHMQDDSRNSYVQNGQWAYSLGYRAGLKQAASPKRTWVGLTDDDWKEVEDMPDSFDQGIAWAQAKLKEKNT